MRKFCLSLTCERQSSYATAERRWRTQTWLSMDKCLFYTDRTQLQHSFFFVISLSQLMSNDDYVQSNDTDNWILTFANYRINRIYFPNYITTLVWNLIKYFNSIHLFHLQKIFYYVFCYTNSITKVNVNISIFQPHCSIYFTEKKNILQVNVWVIRSIQSINTNKPIFKRKICHSNFVPINAILNCTSIFQLENS